MSHAELLRRLSEIDGLLTECQFTATAPGSEASRLLTKARRKLGNVIKALKAGDGGQGESQEVTE